MERKKGTREKEGGGEEQKRAAIFKLCFHNPDPSCVENFLTGPRATASWDWMLGEVSGQKVRAEALERAGAPAWRGLTCSRD